MSAEGTRLPAVVLYRHCPGCGEAVTQHLVDRIRFNAECPGCGAYRLSDFKPGLRSGIKLPTSYRDGRRDGEEP